MYEAVSGVIDVMLGNKRDDQRYRDHVALTKKHKVNMCSDPLVQKICNDLTKLAAKIVCEQLMLSRKPSSSPDMYVTTDRSCSCELYATMRLPCRHMMRLRRTAAEAAAKAAGKKASNETGKCSLSSFSF